MNLKVDLRYVMLGAFLLSLPLTLYPTVTDPMNIIGEAGAMLFWRA